MKESLTLLEKNCNIELKLQGASYVVFSSSCSKVVALFQEDYEKRFEKQSWIGVNPYNDSFEKKILFSFSTLFFKLKSELGTASKEYYDAVFVWIDVIILLSDLFNVTQHDVGLEMCEEVPLPFIKSTTLFISHDN